MIRIPKHAVLQTRPVRVRECIFYATRDPRNYYSLPRCAHLLAVHLADVYIRAVLPSQRSYRSIHPPTDTRWSRFVSGGGLLWNISCILSSLGLFLLIIEVLKDLADLKLKKNEFSFHGPLLMFVGRPLQANALRTRILSRVAKGFRTVEP